MYRKMQLFSFDKALNRIVYPVCNERIVHRVKMYARHVLRDEVGYLVNSISYPCVTQSNLVIAVSVKDLHELVGQLHSAQLDHALYLPLVRHRHYTSLNRNIYPCKLRLLIKIIEIRVVQKQLCDKVISTAVYLIFQMLYIIYDIFAFRVRLRIARRNNIKVIVFLDECYKLVCVAEIAAHFASVGNVSTKCEYVLDAALLYAVKYFPCLSFSQAYAWQVSHAVDAVAVFDLRCDLDRSAAVFAAACAVCHADKIGLDVRKLFKRIVDNTFVRIGFGRKDFKRKDGLFFENISRSHLLPLSQPQQDFSGSAQSPNASGFKSAVRVHPQLVLFDPAEHLADSRLYLVF